MLSSEEKNRGIGLSVFLVAGIALSVLALFQGIFYTRLLVKLTQFIGVHGPVEQSSLYILSGIGAVGLVLFVGIWMWQKWALYLSYAVMLALMVYCYFLEVFSTSSIFIVTLVSIFLLFLFTKNRLHKFL
ncbi:hypothetical protein VMF7928_04295 [Vibrio marisflavi CECT 7928]|uniref:Uncharacterized protein n=1 Tax=Vibrio marisflavi CECT 7928 TaxID=634439 RepID=A0ABN8E8Q4_9VIBR|nr:hypothetical protein VMF7928_04295 [Vibrio marisflavi CECT 7928]